MKKENMRTKEAFNALLKTLEEPPAHVIFILATTEAHKLPETIISRAQRFSFKPISHSDALKHLKYIAGREGIILDEPALELIAAHGDGSFRDSISLLDQISASQKKITKSDVENVLGIATPERIEKLAKIIRNGNAKQLFKELEAAKQQNYNAAATAKQLSEFLRHELINSEAKDISIIKLLKKLLQVPASPDPEQSLELYLLEQLPSNPSVSEKSSSIKKTPPTIT